MKKQPKSKNSGSLFLEQPNEPLKTLGSYRLQCGKFPTDIFDKENLFKDLFFWKERRVHQSSLHDKSNIENWIENENPENPGKTRTWNRIEKQITQTLFDACFDREVLLFGILFISQKIIQPFKCMKSKRSLYDVKCCCCGSGCFHITITR